MPKIILDRSFEQELGGFEHKAIECEIMDSRFGPIAYTRYTIWLSPYKRAYRAGDEVEMTEGEIADAQTILDRVKA
jgi:hypothetical protein